MQRAGRPQRSALLATLPLGCDAVAQASPGRPRGRASVVWEQGAGRAYCQHLRNGGITEAVPLDEHLTPGRRQRAGRALRCLKPHEQVVAAGTGRREQHGDDVAVQFFAEAERDSGGVSRGRAHTYGRREPQQRGTPAGPVAMPARYSGRGTLCTPSGSLPSSQLPRSAP